MREIKFRVWDVFYNKFLYSKEGNLNGFFHAVEQRPKSERLVQQFTGIHDKNGKEIYEGDILMFDDTESEYVDVGIGEVKVAERALNAFFPIEYDRGEFGMTVTGTEHGIDGWISLRAFGEDYYAPDMCEVIGNIYENPELLSDNK